MMPMTSTIPAGEDAISIHVYDPALGLEHVFQCSKELLASRVGYFANQMNYDRLTIENCDLCLFDWLIRWLHGEGPTFATTNVLRILLLASFLSIEHLVQQCIDFCIEEKVDMSCLAEGDLLRLAPHATASQLERLAGAGTAGTGRLFYELLAAWTGTRGAQPLQGNFCDLSRVGRCRDCSAIVHADRQRTADGCPHSVDQSWNLLGHVAGLHRQTRSWRRTYWTLWGQVHHFLCSRCRVYFTAGEMGGAARFPCCERRVRERDFLLNAEGCVTASRSADDVCRALYETMGTYLSRVTREPDSSECELSEPIIDMSMIWRRGRRLSAVLETSTVSCRAYEDSDEDRTSCGDPSEDGEDASLRTESVKRWVYDDYAGPGQTTVDARKHEGETPNKSLLGPHGDSPDIPGKHSVWGEGDRFARSGLQTRTNKELRMMNKDQRHTPEENGSNGGELMPKITRDDKCSSEDCAGVGKKQILKVMQDGKCSSEDNARDGSKWKPKITYDSKCSSDDGGSNDSKWMPKFRQDGKCSSEETESNRGELMPNITHDSKCSSDDDVSDDTKWMPKIIHNGKRNSDDSASDGNKWLPKITHDGKCSSEETESNSGELMLKITLDGKCSSEDSASDGSKRMPKVTPDGKHSVEDSASDGSDCMPCMTHDESADDNPSNSSECMPKVNQDDKYSVNNSASDGSEWSPTTTRKYAYGAEGNDSLVGSECSENYASNVGSDEYTASSESQGEEMERAAEQGTGEESTAEDERSPEVTSVAAHVGDHGRRRHERYRHWQPHLSSALNQINQHDQECLENERIVHYLTSRIYKLRRARYETDELPSDDRTERSKWLTHIVPKEGMYTQIENELIGPRTRVDRSPSDMQCERTNVSTNVLYKQPTCASDLLDQNE